MRFVALFMNAGLQCAACSIAVCSEQMQRCSVAALQRAAPRRSVQRCSVAMQRAACSVAVCSIAAMMQR